jgi:hypothetical protein
MNVRHALALAGTVALLSGCTAMGPDTTPSPAQAPTATASPAATPEVTTSPAATPAATPEATRSWQQSVVAKLPVDSGPVEHARGSVALNDSGVPVEYVVASDDNAGAICNRLGVRWWQLEDPSGERLGTYPMLYPGDVITIIATDAVVDKREATNALC